MADWFLYLVDTIPGELAFWWDDGFQIRVEQLRGMSPEENERTQFIRMTRSVEAAKRPRDWLNREFPPAAPHTAATPTPEPPP